MRSALVWRELGYICRCLRVLPSTNFLHHGTSIGLPAHPAKTGDVRL